MTNKGRRSARRSRRTFAKGWRRWSARKLKRVKWTGRERESGHAEPRKLALMSLGRENIPIVLSRAFHSYPAKICISLRLGSLVPTHAIAINGISSQDL
jgi:hypothetical protein